MSKLDEAIKIIESQYKKDILRIRKYGSKFIFELDDEFCVGEGLPIVDIETLELGMINMNPFDGLKKYLAAEVVYSK